ncbi:uncharacterized protein LOC132786333 [Drosophila nasuta]|uniref:uncharacterized protein LOC132786333 n=1 Tax=Drosophila nasuta TaxID=42062 RepID=UPI00295E368F|nr:uncharacterized protein LOC132786333 [Drosophila nasuta]
MCLKISLLLLGLGMTTAYRVQHSLKSVAKIEKLHSESKALAEGREDVSTRCFAQYNPQFGLIVDRYEIDYDACINAYKASSSKIEESFRDTRQLIENSAYSSCQSLKSCNQSSTAYSAFECAAEWALEDSKVFYEISANATVAAAKIKADLLQVDTAKSMCLNEAERNYVENTSEVYGLLNDCLSGKQTTTPSIPWPTTTTRAPIIWASTTAAY